MQIEVIPYKPQHIYEMADRELTEEEHQATRRAETFGKSYTMLLCGDPICSAGIFAPVRPGIGECWTYLEHPLIKSGRLSMSLRLTRAVKKLIPITMEELGLHRVIAPIDCANETNIAWIEALGFKREGRMTKYCIDKDYYLYARVKES